MSEPLRASRSAGENDDPTVPPLEISLTGAAATLLAPLYARALDARSPHPLLGDQAAAALVARTEYDFGRLGINETNAVGVALRTRWFDRQVRRFLADHRHATVVHLGCGLDDRFSRLAPGPDVRWYDLDQPEVIDLHRTVYPAHPARRTVAASVTDPEWTARVPADAPVLVVAEGLSMYLQAEDGPQVLRRIVEQFPRGQLVLDTYSRFAVGSTRRFALFVEPAPNSPGVSTTRVNSTGKHPVCDSSSPSAPTAPRRGWISVDCLHGCALAYCWTPRSWRGCLCWAVWVTSHATRSARTPPSDRLPSARPRPFAASTPQFPVSLRYLVHAPRPYPQAVNLRKTGKADPC
ncbi:class I SAM-dependent methyltransferase (plasmid) [Streptomyces cavourensis]